MPLSHGKSKQAFEHNLKAEIHAGKPMSQSLAIAYNMKRKAKKMANGGHAHDERCAEGCYAEGGNVLDSSHRSDNERGINKVAYTSRSHNAGTSEAGAALKPSFSLGDEHDSDVAKMKHRKVLQEMKSSPRPKLMANGGPLTADDVPEAPRKNAEEMQRGALQSGPTMAEAMHSIRKAFGSDEDTQTAEGYAMGGDVVDRIIAKRKNMYSEGGQIANGGDDDLDKMADGDPNNFDDLALRDGLSSSYGHDDNSGDALGNAQEAEDREDIIARIMRQRKMKQHNPSPA